MFKSLHRKASAIILFFFTALVASAASAQPFQTSVPQAILIDAGTNTVLFEKGADDFVTPASTVKILTAEIIFRELAEGRLKLADEFAGLRIRLAQRRRAGRRLGDVPQGQQPRQRRGSAARPRDRLRQ